MQHYPPLDPWGAATAGPAATQQQHYPGAHLPQQPGYPGAAPYGQQLAQPQGHQYPGLTTYPSQAPMQQPTGYPAAPSGYPGGPGYSQPQAQPQQLQQQHHQHQQHLTPQAVGTAVAGQVAVVDPRFCCAQPHKLILKEAITMGSYGNDNFQIMDSQGRIHFMLKASHFSMSEKRVLYDPSGHPVVGMAKKLFSLKPTWVLYRGGNFADSSQVATVKANFSLTPSVSVYLNDGDRESDFKIRGNFRSKKFAVTQKLPGGKERQIAEVKKESRLSSATAFLTAALTQADNYYLQIEPGVDAAFAVSIALLVDELFHDKEQH